MFETLGQSIASRSTPSQKAISFGPWYGGLVTEFQPEQMSTNELFNALNIVLVGKGIARTRDGSTLVCSGCTGKIVQCDDIKIGSTWYTIISDDDKKIYYNNLGTATAIATLEGEPRFVGFMGLLLIFDGSYIKVWDGTTLSMAYDNGLGSVSPYQFNNRYDTETMFKPLGNGTATRIDRAFTSQTWDAGYTIPPTHVHVKMRKVGTPTGTVTVKLRLAADDTVLASSEITTTVADFVTGDDGLEYEAIILSSEITTEMSPDTAYLLTLEYSGGDASNYVDVLAVDASTPVMSLRPGRPPKAVFGIVDNDRLHCIEGEDGTNPSYRWYCNAGNHLDWSSADGGGYTPVADSSGTNYAIGGLAVWNSSIWFFGTKRQPYLGPQTGTSPSEWKITPTMQNISGNYRSIVVTPNDIVFAHPAGIDMISSVQESSDIAVKTQTDKIRTTIRDNFSTSSVAGYDPEWGLYYLKMDGDDHTYVVHTRAKAIRYSGQMTEGYSPVTRWKFAWNGTPTSFGKGNGFAIIGTDDGKVYKMDKSKIKDESSDIEFKMKTFYFSTSFGEMQATKINLNIFGQMGGLLNLKFYKNASRDSFLTIPMVLPIGSDTPTIRLTDILTADATFSIFGTGFFDRVPLNFNFRTLMIGIEDIELQGKPVYFGPATLLANHIGGF